MAKLIYIFLIPLTLFAYATQAQAYSGFYNDSTKEVFSEKGRKGVKNESGNIILDPKYQAFGWSDGNNRELEYIGFKENNLWGLMTSDLEVTEKAKYKSLVPFQDDLFIAAEKSKYSKINFYGLINSSGRTKLKFNYRNITPADDHLIAALKKEQDIYFGILNSSGKTIIPFEYFNIRYLGHDNFTLTKNSGVKELIKLSNKPEALFQGMDSVSEFKEGVAIIFKNGKQGLIRQDGKVLLAVEYKKIDWNNGKKIDVTPLDEWTVIDINGKNKSRFKADSIFYLNDSLLVKNTSSFAQIFNTHTQKNQQLFNADVKDIFGDYFILNDGSRYFLAEDSNQIVSEKFTGKVFWNEDFFIANKKTYDGNKSIIINTSAKSIESDTFSILNDLIALEINLNWGLYNKDLEEIIPPLYTAIENSYPNQYIVKFKDQFGVIDRRNNWLIPPQYRSIISIDSGYYKMVDNYLREFISNGTAKSEAKLYFDFYGQFGVEQDVNNQFRLINRRKGEGITPFIKGTYNGNDSESILFNHKTEHFLLNKKGDELFRIDRHDSIIFTKEKYLAVLKNGHWGLIDRKGKLRIANRYDTIRSFSNNRAAIKIRNLWGFINRDEDLTIQPYFSKVSDFKNQTAIVQYNGKFGVINTDGSYIIEPEYDEITNENEYYLIRKGEKWGFALQNGEILSYPTYDKISIYRSFIAVEKYGSTRILDLKGNNLINRQFNNVYFDARQNIFIAKKDASTEQVFLTDILLGKYP